MLHELPDPAKPKLPRTGLVRVDNELRAQLKIAAAVERKSIADITQEALREWMIGHHERQLRPH